MRLCWRRRSPAEGGQSVIEAGCGAGAVLMQIAARRPGVTLTGVERDPAMAALATENAALNGAAGSAVIRQGDVAAGFRAVGVEPADWAISNPPFFDDATALRAPAEGKRGAWMADDGLKAWTDFLLKAVKEAGASWSFTAPTDWPICWLYWGEKAGSFAVRPIHPFADEPAKRVLVHAIKTGRAPLLLPPLILHDREGGKHTPQAEAILRGDASLGW